MSGCDLERFVLCRFCERSRYKFQEEFENPVARHKQSSFVIGERIREVLREPGNTIDVSGVEMQQGSDLEIPVTGITGTTFYQVVVLGEYGHAIGGPQARSQGDVDPNLMWRATPEAQAALGPAGLTVAGHPSIFPSTWITSAPVQLSLRIPRDPTHTEIWWFSFTDRNLPTEMQEFLATVASRVFGPAGVLEQDDGENWAQATAQTYGLASRRRRHLLNMGVGRGRVIHEHGLHRIEGLTSEHGQRWTYYAWAQWMKGLDWDQLAAATTPGDVL